MMSQRTVLCFAVLMAGGVFAEETSAPALPVTNVPPVSLAQKIEGIVMSNLCGKAECVRCTCNNKQSPLSPTKVIAGRTDGLKPNEWIVRAEWTCWAHGAFAREFRIRYDKGKVMKAPGKPREIRLPIDAKGLSGLTGGRSE